MENFYDRLEVALAEKSLDFSDLREVLPNTTYYRWKRKEGEPSKRAVEDVARFVGISAEWLLDGSGPMVSLERGTGAQTVKESPSQYLTSKMSGNRSSLEAIVKVMSQNEVSEFVSRLLLEAELGDTSALSAAREIMQMRTSADS